MSITINGSGSITGLVSGGLPDGSVTAADLADTYLTPTGDGSQLTNLPGGGKVLQVVQGTLTSAFSTSSSSYVDTGLSATITPSSSSSKILVLVNGQIDRPATAYEALRLNLLRGSTSIWGGNDANSFYSVSNTGFNDFHMSLNVLDAPSTTSATTYKLQLKARTGSTVSFAPQAGANNQNGYILLMEIAG
jgi:hypothetical protein